MSYVVVGCVISSVGLGPNDVSDCVSKLVGSAYDM